METSFNFPRDGRFVGKHERFARKWPGKLIEINKTFPSAFAASDKTLVTARCEVICTAALAQAARMNLVWVTLGNIVGGVMVGITYWFVYLNSVDRSLGFTEELLSQGRERRR